MALAMPQNVIPLDGFNRSSFVSVNGSRRIVFDRNRREHNTIEELKEKQHNYSDGIKTIFEILLEIIQSKIDIGRKNHAKVAEDYNEIYDQYKGVPPPKSEAMICEVSDNIVLPVIRKAVAGVLDILDEGFFKYEPPDFRGDGPQLAEALEAIARNQIESGHFYRELKFGLGATAAFGWCPIISEEDMEIEPAVPGYRERSVRRRLGFRHVQPYFAFVQKVEEPDIQSHPAFFYAHEIHLSFMR